MSATAVSVSGMTKPQIHRFCVEHNLYGKTIPELQKFVKALTESEKITFTEYLGKHQPVKAANYFVSYTWGLKIDEVLDALGGLDDDEPVWLDVFCANQHNPGISEPSVLQNVFETAVKRIGKMIIIMSNWNDPDCVKRIWCVFEHMVAAITGVPVCP